MSGGVFVEIYELVLTEARPFLADQTEAFISRQCKVHLNITKETLTREDLPKLAWWVRISSSLVISKEKADILAERITALAF
jgi:hypothetical protein